jgi:hypothetical protein
MPRLSKIGAAALAAFGWTGGASVTASYLVVAGGGGGGSYRAGVDGTASGGGAGGLLTSTAALNPTLSYTVIVGAGGVGGSGGSDAATLGANGSNSSLGSLVTSTGGGGGGGGATPTTSYPAGSGGSGGGQARVGAVGAGISGQGYAGGTMSAGNNNGGGGGGAGAVGGNATSGVAGSGGVGLSSSISGTATYYAGGGGAGQGDGTSGSGGNGGGGAGSGASNGNGRSGTANLGGGGGGGGTLPTTYTSGNGGSGVVIISYLGAQQFGGGVVTSVGGNTIHTFLTSGTLSPLNSLSASYLIVAGGGSTGSTASGYAGGGGAGAGGLLTGSGLTIDTSSTYLVTVGAGAATVGGSGTNGLQGSNSSFSLVSTTAVGGGGGSETVPTTANGGSGGGATYNYSAGTGTAGQGNNGGTSSASAPNYGGGGGGGAGAVGGNGTSTVAGNGGVGVASSISGTSTYYAGGGGGGTGFGGGTAGTGGLGGGGNGGTPSGGAGGSGTANTGGGAGSGSGNGTYAGGNGGSGIVIISYAGSTQLMAGGTVTITGGNVIHTFTSSGYLTPLTYVGNSLRFRASASAYLNKTLGTPTDANKFTFSFWAKRGKLSSAQTIFSVSNTDYIQFNASDNIQIVIGNSVCLTTSAVYRDPAAWYHFVFSFDNSSSPKWNFYVNGINGGTGTLGSATYNTAVAHYIANIVSGGGYYDGEMTEIRFIDGQTLTPNSFGTFNSYGVWQPITYGGSYGTNGFYLPFTGSSSYAGSFNGSSQYLNLGGQSNFAYGTGDFTIEFWINATSYSGTPLIYDGRPTSSQGAYPTIYIDSTGVPVYYTNSAGRIISPTAITTNTWNHIAVVRSGTTTTLYLNGVSQGTYSDTTDYLNGTNRPTIAAAGFGGATNLLNGYLSNFRLVKGTAVYTSNFTPSTIPLTAITNTQLLTLQNATIVDNSTNAFTITNNGTVTTSQTYPFTMLAGKSKDYSPAGNNWTNNNISVLSGSTLDVMTDVPTLTSATAANYAVLNPLNTPATVKFANLGFAGFGSDWYPIVATIGVSSGKFYWEAIYNANFQYGMTGIVPTTFVPSVGSYPGSTSTSYGYWSYLGNKYNNGTGTSYGASYTGGDVIGVALDMDAGTITFYKNNTSQGVAFTGLTGTYMPAFASYVDCTVNFGQQPFVYTPPSGFVALNTYNL